MSSEADAPNRTGASGLSEARSQEEESGVAKTAWGSKRGSMRLILGGTVPLRPAYFDVPTLRHGLAVIHLSGEG